MNVTDYPLLGPGRPGEGRREIGARDGTGSAALCGESGEIGPVPGVTDARRRHHSCDDRASELDLVGGEGQDAVARVVGAKVVRAARRRAWCRLRIYDR